MGRSGRALHFLGCLQGCDGLGEGWGILQIKASVVQWKDIRPWQSEFGPDEKHFVSGNYGNSIFLFLEEQRSCDGGGRLAPPFGMIKSPKRRVRARAAKTH